MEKNKEPKEERIIDIRVCYNCSYLIINAKKYSLKCKYEFKDMKKIKDNYYVCERRTPKTTWEPSSPF